jgi:hypothetical protein
MLLLKPTQQLVDFMMALANSALMPVCRLKAEWAAAFECAVNFSGTWTSPSDS